MSVRIMVAYGKHGDDFIDASTDEKWAQNALALLTERDETGYYYSDPGPKPQYDGLTKEQIEDLPDESLKRVAQQKRSRWRQQLQWWQTDKQWWDRMREVVDNQDAGTITLGRPGTRWEREVPKAWQLLYDRSDHEYERIELEEARDLNGRA